MKIGLLDIDGHNFPNLALMKISSYHKAKGDSVEWLNHFNHYDIVFKSKIFTYTQDNLFSIDSNVIMKGGTGYNPKTELPVYIDEYNCDYSLYPNLKHAYGFLTRGCVRACAWCIVPQKEGWIHKYWDIERILQGKKSAVLMDNNVLASPYGIEQIEKIGRLGVKVDFNQGLDARLIDLPMAKLLAKVKWLSPLRMSCDTDSMIPYLEQATAYLREEKCKPSNYFIYVLVKDIESAHERVTTLNSMGLDPFAQPFIDFSGKNNVTKEQKRFARWVNHKAIFRSVKWEDYK